MKRVRSAMLRMLRTTLAVALALPVFAAQPAIAAVTIDPLVAGINVPNDHTPVLVEFTASGLSINTTYAVTARFVKSGGTSPADDRGFIRDPITDQWKSFDTTYSQLPTVTADGAGAIPATPLSVKFGDERTSGTYDLVVSLLDAANGSLVTSRTFLVGVLDMQTTGAILHGTVASNATVAVTETVTPFRRFGYAQASGAGAYRVVAPLGIGNLDITENGTSIGGVAPIHLIASRADQDIAISAVDTIAPLVPGNVVALPGQSSVVVTWAASIDNPGGSGIAAYNVYRWTDAPAGAKYTPEHTLLASTASIPYTDATAVDGVIYNYEIRAVDTSTNVGARSKTVRSMLDTVAPVLTKPFVGTPSSAKFSIAATDGALGSGVKAFQYTIKNVASATAAPVGVMGPDFTTITPPVTIPGTYTISLMSTDTAGNVRVTTPETFTVVADATKPSVVATLTGTNSANNAFVISATDAGIGVSGLQYKISPTPGATSTPTTTTVPGPSFAATLPITAPGSYTASWIASDLAGNSTTGTLAFAVVSSDTVAPITSTTPIPAGWTKDSVTVTMTVVETLSVPPVTYYRLNGGTTTVYAGPLTFSADGTHTIEYWSVDKAWPIGNKETTKTATIRIDKTLPSIVVTATGAFPATTTIGATVTDALSGVAWTRYRVNGGAWTTGTATVASVPGTYAVDFEVQDNAGNLKSLSTTTIITGSTSISRRASTVVNYGSFATISGVLSAGSLDTTGVAVRLEYLSGSTWKAYPGVTAVTGPGGAYTMRFKPSRNNRLRVALVQTGYLAASTSAEWFMGVRPYVGLQSVGTQRANRTFSMYATMYPRHSAVVKFSVYRKVGSSYRLYRTYNVRNTAIYRARITLRAGTYRIRASHVDSVHLLGVSPYRTVRVR